MPQQKTLKIGTLIEDLGKLGVIYRCIEQGSLDVEIPLIKWRLNYESYYFDGVITVLGEGTLNRLISQGTIKILDDKQNKEL